MKKILLVSLWIAGLFSCTHPSSYREDFVRIYFEKYPESTLQDIYKGSFQDVFGPAHILTDREAVTKYIKYEMKLPILGKKPIILHAVGKGTSIK